VVLSLSTVELLLVVAETADEAGGTPALTIQTAQAVAAAVLRLLFLLRYP
jgi:hypothetical protein